MHNTYVKSVVPADQLLTFNLTYDWEPLCKFLNVQTLVRWRQSDGVRATQTKFIADWSETKLIKVARRHCETFVGSKKTTSVELKTYVAWYDIDLSKYMINISSVW